MKIEETFWPYLTWIFLAIWKLSYINLQIQITIMGVRGLGSFITKTNKENLLQQICLQDQYLIIDGNVISMCLRETANFNDFFGGEYDQFYEYALNFLKTLLKYNITPILVFDFSSEKLKSSTILLKWVSHTGFRGWFFLVPCFMHCRLQRNLKEGLRASPNTPCRSLRPMFCYEILQNAARDLKLEVHCCVGSSSQWIAMLAREKCCPVLTRDSDFFLIDIKHGVVYYDLVEWYEF